MESYRTIDTGFYELMPRIRRDRDDRDKQRVPTPIIIDINNPDSEKDKPIKRMPYLPPFHKPGIHPPGTPPTRDPSRNYRYL